MKNKEFFYQQYNKLKWENQEKNKLNYNINKYIIGNIISQFKGNEIKIFDMGFGIGYFLNMLYNQLSRNFNKIVLEGCEPSIKNYQYFIKKKFKIKKIDKLTISNKNFLKVQTRTKFNFLTSIYVFPHITSDDLEKTTKKIYSMLEKDGRFILVVANEKYIKNKLKTKKDLFIEENIIQFNGKKYHEVLHYSELPDIGTIIDYNRDEKYYIDLFKKYKLKLDSKTDFNDHGFIATIFVFNK